MLRLAVSTMQWQPCNGPLGGSAIKLAARATKTAARTGYFDSRLFVKVRKTLPRATERKDSPPDESKHMASMPGTSVGQLTFPLW
jgi:hypothetical protein